jgi:hypothetical protein
MPRNRRHLFTGSGRRGQLLIVLAILVTLFSTSVARPSSGVKQATVRVELAADSAAPNHAFKVRSAKGTCDYVLASQDFRQSTEKQCRPWTWTVTAPKPIKLTALSNYYAVKTWQSCAYGFRPCGPIRRCQAGQAECRLTLRPTKNQWVRVEFRLAH